MGVTLERVQNKFACIIGELCSEPLLLSQFAIWVDLRISEYKSKGTISLDCSGTTPDPSWLKGHVVQSIPTAGSSDNGRGRSGSASIRNSLPHKSIHSSRDPGRGSNYPSNNRTDGNVDNSDIGSDRISPDVQVIKQESDSAFPVSLHQHSAKKRHSEDDLSQGESFYEDSSFSGPKVRRMDSAADESSAVDSPSNQSFMSVIGDSLQDNDDASDNSMMVAGDEQSKGGNQSFGFTPRAGTSFSMPSTSATPGTSSSAGRFDRTHTCGECGFTFSRAGHLKRHMLTHAPAPPKFDCSLCDRKYSRKEHLTRHIMKGHSPHAEAKRAALAKRKTIKTNSSQTSGTENPEQSDAHALGSAAFPEQADTVYPIVSQDDQSQTSQHVTPYPGMGISSTITMATHQGLERLYPSVLHTATGLPTPSVANGDSAVSVSAMRYNMNMGVASSDIITRLGEEQAMGWFKNT